ARHGSTELTLLALAHTAGLATALGHHAAAVWWASAIEATRERTGYSMDDGTRRALEADAATAHAAVAAAAFASAGSGGQGVGLDEAVAEAQRFLAGVRDTPAEAQPARAAEPRWAGLSPREAEVLRLIAAGQSNHQIAATLVISLNTVERHVNH